MTEVSVFPVWLTVLLAVWAPVGPLVGLLVGHYLVRSWERKRWLADNRKQEYRQVLTCLNKLNILMIDWDLGTSREMQPVKFALDEFVTALNTSLFIGEVFEQYKVAADIGEAVRKLMNGGPLTDYRAEYWKSVNLILNAAKKSAL